MGLKELIFRKKVCPFCGTTIGSSDSEFCNKCGHLLSDATELTSFERFKKEVKRLEQLSISESQKEKGKESRFGHAKKDSPYIDQLAGIINNYSEFDTPEAVLSFITFAAGQVDSKALTGKMRMMSQSECDIRLLLSRIWMSKMEQVCTSGAQMFSDNEVFQKANSVFLTKKKEITRTGLFAKIARIKPVYIWGTAGIIIIAVVVGIMAIVESMQSGDSAESIAQSAIEAETTTNSDSETDTIVETTFESTTDIETELSETEEIIEVTEDHASEETTQQTESETETQTMEETSPIPVVPPTEPETTAQIVEETTVQATTAQIVEETTVQATTETSPEEAIMVYVTATGKRYHYSKECAGEKAVEVSLYQATKVSHLTPCQKCAQ